MHLMNESNHTIMYQVCNRTKFSIDWNINFLQDLDMRGHILCMNRVIVIYILNYFRLQEKHVKEKQCEHQKNIIELQDKLKKNQIQVGLETRIYFVL